MPQEAINFRKVDKSWRAIMNNTDQVRKVLECTDYENLLEILRENNVLLDEIQKSLNDYLEKKRLYFPRYVFGTLHTRKVVFSTECVVTESKTLQLSGSFSYQTTNYWRFCPKRKTLNGFSLI